MPVSQILSYEQAKRFYDWMGAKQDTQCFYEQPALADLVAHLELTRSEKVIEFGCGTGRFAEELFNRLEALRWKQRHRNVVTPFAIASEIVVVAKI
jgi:ubiquinone/menaquinone biosynthesis C-methylase UbiE